MKSKEFTILYEALCQMNARLEALARPEKEEVLLTSDQMLVLLNCSPATLYRLRSKGIIPCSKIGGQYRYPKYFFTREVINSIIKAEDPSKRFDDQ